MFGSGRPPVPPTPQPQRQAAPAPSSLPPPPEGYAWATDAVHGFRLVQIAPPRAPAPQIVSPGSSIGPGQVAMPAARRGSCQLLRPGTAPGGGVADTYQHMLDGLTDLVPGTPGLPANLFAELVPDPSVADAIPRPHAIYRGDENAQLNPDAAEDAWGAARPMLVSVPLAGTGD